MAGLSYTEEGWNGLHRKLRELIDREVILCHLDPNHPFSFLTDGGADIAYIPFRSKVWTILTRNPRNPLMLLNSPPCSISSSGRTSQIRRLLLVRSLRPLLFRSKAGEIHYSYNIIHSPTYPLLKTLCSRDTIKSDTSES